ncbi:unnamed protein product [Schistocephalus solidus]|uniref:Protein FAR1-RELATED SEQUENCE n=1 Tax=Schistocephalus solidus TaxID=70667 RepID=A0A183SEB9_SCHSO|nr:unnamed protein product [Schistocephalus solidus]
MLSVAAECELEPKKEPLMDLTSEFDVEICSQRFYSFSELQTKVDEFCTKFGVRFIIKRSSKVDSTHPLRDSLIYKSIRYECDCQRTNGCPCFFTIGMRKLVMRVIRRWMQHNHLGKPFVGSRMHSIEPRDGDSSSRALFVSMFATPSDTFADFYAKLTEFGQVGKALTVKVGCPVRIEVNSSQGCLKVSSFELNHNHIQMLEAGGLSADCANVTAVKPDPTIPPPLPPPENGRKGLNVKPGTPEQNADHLSTSLVMTPTEEKLHRLLNTSSGEEFERRLKQIEALCDTWS